MAHSITLIPGDGIGPEVSDATRKIIEAAGVKIDWHVHEAGNDVINRYGTPLPQETLDSIMRDKVALKGPIGTPIGSGFASVNVQLRKSLDLYANFRPAKIIKGVKSRYDNVDLIVVRENTQGLYSGLEHIVVPGVVESIRVITEKGSERIVKFAFEAAKKYNRKRVTAVHKANILKKSDGLFLEVARRIARNYPEIQYDEAIVDSTAMKLVMNPEQFDVLVMENLFGDIISDLTSGLVGGLGLAPSANIGEKYAIFEAVHGSAPDIAGKGLANPTALLLSSVLMLRHIGETEAADRIEKSVEKVIQEAKVLTKDLGGSANTNEYTEELIRNL
ncbi:MAG: isocitrate dehydrogenase (NAD(+)) [Candidatus Sericytochromatia bacterium]